MAGWNQTHGEIQNYTTTMSFHPVWFILQWQLLSPLVVKQMIYIKEDFIWSLKLIIQSCILRCSQKMYSKTVKLFVFQLCVMFAQFTKEVVSVICFCIRVTSALTGFTSCDVKWQSQMFDLKNRRFYCNCHTWY